MTDTTIKKVYYISPSSFCMGVKRSINELNKIVENHPNDQIFCVHELVHNPKVNKQFKDKGVVFVENINLVENGKLRVNGEGINGVNNNQKPSTIHHPSSINNKVICFSAHGTNRETILEAKKKYRYVYNLECPLVTKIYNEIDLYISQGIQDFVYIGKASHQEGKNVVEYIKYLGKNVEIFESLENLTKKFDSDSSDGSDQSFAILSQTTLNYKFVVDSVDQIKTEFPGSISADLSDVCKATFDRQNAIIDKLDQFDTLIVIGGKDSNNTKELYNIGVEHQKKSFFVEDLKDLLENFEAELFLNDKVAVTGGASTPDEDIREIFNYFVGKGYSPFL